MHCPFQRGKGARASQTMPLLCRESWPQRRLSSPPGLFHVWATSCSPPALPGPPSLPPSAMRPPPSALSLRYALTLWDIGVFVRANPSKSAPTQSLVVWRLRARGVLWSPAAIQTLSRGIGLRPTPGQHLPQPGLRKGTAERTILICGDSDPSRRDSPG